jgi:photosystem II stability/assembly factor-like uncharacterized protein
VERGRQAHTTRRATFTVALVAALAAALVGSTLTASCGGRRATSAADPYVSLRSPGPAPSPRPGVRVWAVGMPLLVLTSADGGATWRVAQHTSPGDPFTQVLFGVCFGDARHGWAVGKGQVIVATTDGGATWTPQRAGTNEGDLLDVAATDARHVWAVGFTHARSLGLVLASVDGGRTWRAQYDGTDVLSAVTFVDARHGWAAGTTGILATDDGGARWVLQRPLPSFYHLNDVTFVDARHGWAVGGTGGAVVKPGFIMATTDGGRRWRLQLSGARDLFNGVTFVGDRRGWVAGDEGQLYTTTDGGATWTLRQMDRHWELGTVSFGDARHGWLIVHPHWQPNALAATQGDDWGVLRQLTLLATSDGGASWSAVSTAGDVPAPAIITDVACRGANGR